MPHQCDQDGAAEDRGEIDLQRVVGRHQLGEHPGEHHRADDDQARRRRAAAGGRTRSDALARLDERRGGNGGAALAMTVYAYRMRGSNTA